MGCGSSKASPIGAIRSDATLLAKQPVDVEKDAARPTENDIENAQETNEAKTVQSAGSTRYAVFDVPVEEKPLKPPPKRFEKSEGGNLTSEKLEEKQRAAEERKQKELEKKRISKRDRLHRDIKEAREMEKTKTLEELESRLAQVEKKREEAQRAIIKKQRDHAIHAQRVREKAKGLVLNDSGMEDLDTNWAGEKIEHDDQYNVESEADDSWGDDDNENNKEPKLESSTPNSNREDFSRS